MFPVGGVLTKFCLPFCITGMGEILTPEVMSSRILYRWTPAAFGYRRRDCKWKWILRSCGFFVESSCLLSIMKRTVVNKAARTGHWRLDAGSHTPVQHGTQSSPRRKEVLDLVSISPTIEVAPHIKAPPSRRKSSDGRRS